MVFGRLTPYYKYGLKDHKILIFKVLFSVSKIGRIFQNFFSLKNIRLGPQLLLVIFKVLFFNNMLKIECQIYNWASICQRFFTVRKYYLPFNSTTKKIMNSKPAKTSPNLRFGFIKSAHLRTLLERLWFQFVVTVARKILASTKIIRVSRKGFYSQVVQSHPAQVGQK